MIDAVIQYSTRKQQIVRPHLHECLCKLLPARPGKVDEEDIVDSVPALLRAEEHVAVVLGCGTRRWKGYERGEVGRELLQGIPEL